MDSALMVRSEPNELENWNFEPSGKLKDMVVLLVGMGLG